MELTPRIVQELMNDHFPRHISDIQVTRLSAKRVPLDSIAIVVDSQLWDTEMPLGRMLGSMTISLARHLYDQLGAALESLDVEHS